MSSDRALRKETGQGEDDANRGIDPSLKHAQLVAATERRIARRTAARAPRLTGTATRLARTRAAAEAATRNRDIHVRTRDEVSAQVRDLEADALADAAGSVRMWDRRVSLATAVRVVALLVLLVSEIPVNQLVFETLGVNGPSTLALVLGIQAAVLAIAHFAGSHFARQRRRQALLLLISCATAVVTIVMLGQLRGVALIQDMMFLRGDDPSEAPGLGAGAAIGLFVAIQLLFATATALLGAAGGQALTLRPLQQRRVALKRRTRTVSRAERSVIRATARHAAAQARVDGLARAATADVEAIVASAEERWRAYQRGALGSDPGQFPLHHRLGSIAEAISSRRGIETTGAIASVPTVAALLVDPIAPLANHGGSRP